MGETSTTRSEIVSEDMIASSSAETQKRNALPRRTTSSHAFLLLLLFFLLCRPLLSPSSRERERANKELRTRAGAFLVRDGGTITRLLWEEEEIRETLFFFLLEGGKVFLGEGGKLGRDDFPSGGSSGSEEREGLEGKEPRRFIGLSRAVEGIILLDVARSWEVFPRIFFER